MAKILFLGISDTEIGSGVSDLAGTRLGSIASLFGLIAVCILIVAASYFVTRLVGGKQLARQKNSNFKTIDTFHLAQNKYLSLIQVGTRYFVIAICKDTVTMLSELAREDIAVWREEKQNTAGFKSILDGMLKNRPDIRGKERSGSDHPSGEYDDDIK